MQLRVRSLDGAEIVLELAPLTVRVQVAEIKRRSLAELQRLRATTSTTEASAVADLDDSCDGRMARACLTFRGQLLADVDDVNLFALAPTDFFVLIEETEAEEDDEEEEEEEEDRAVDDADKETKSSEPNANAKTPKRQQQAKAKTDKIDEGLEEVVILQLVEMGFDVEQARGATALAHGDLPRAIALLMGEVDASARIDRKPSHRNRLQQFVKKLVGRYSELAAIESLLMHEQVHTLKRIALRNDFEALVLLKESFPAHWLAQMNENPAATALFLAVPEQFESAGSNSTPSTPARTKKKPTKKAMLAHQDAVDLTSESAASGQAPPVMRSRDQDAIDRLTAMGFASDLVVAIYESCGGNEELAANLLLETLS